MRRKVYLAAILAAVMALQAPVVAFAETEGTEAQTTSVDQSNEEENGSWNINGDVTITDDSWSSTDSECEPPKDENNKPSKSVSAGKGDVVTVNGDVSSTVSQKEQDDDGNEYVPSAVDAADGGTVNVNGDVTSQSGGAISADNGTVKVTGNVSSGGKEASVVYAANGSTVEVGGNVTNTGNGRVKDNNEEYGTSNGIDVTGSSTVKVGGDVTVSSGTGMNVNGEEKSTEKGQGAVDGSVSSAQDPAIITNAASEITVGEDVTGNTGIVIRLNGTGGKVEVLGTVKSTKENASVLVIETTETDKDKIANALPEIIVGSLEGAAGSPDDFLYVDSVGEDESKRDEVYEAVYQQIRYYIAQDKFANATLSVAGASGYKNGYTSTEGKSLTVTIATADGYEVSSVSGTSVVRNADGTYTVVVQRGKGIDINAVISAIVKAQEVTSSGRNDNHSSSDNAESAVIVVPAYAAAQKQFQAAIAAQLKTLPAGGTLMLDMKDCISFNKKTFEILSQRKDVDIQIIYTWKGKKYLVVIPAGYDILSLLNADGYCGCLYLNSIFGSIELTK